MVEFVLYYGFSIWSLEVAGNTLLRSYSILIFKILLDDFHCWKC